MHRCVNGCSVRDHSLSNETATLMFVVHTIDDDICV